MRALWRHCLAPLILTAAVLFTGGPAHFAAVAATHPSGAAIAVPICPAGTNWDDAVRACVRAPVGIR
jgi:hypothetical protein